MVDQAGPDVAHDPFADDRVQVALINADDAGKQCAGDHSADRQPDRVHVVLGDGAVDQPAGEQRRQEAEQRDEHDAGQNGALLHDVRAKERQDAGQIDPLRHLRTIGTEHVGPHQVDRGTAAEHFYLQTVSARRSSCYEVGSGSGRGRSRQVGCDEGRTLALRSCTRRFIADVHSGKKRPRPAAVGTPVENARCHVVRAAS